MDEDWGLSSTSSSSSSEDEDIEQKSSRSFGRKRTHKPCGLFQLPFEILSHIFILSSNPALPVTCRHLYHHLYYCHDTIKIAFLLNRSNQNLQKAFEEAVKFNFFNSELMQRFERMDCNIHFKNKKIPSRLFLLEPNEERDQLIVALLKKGASPDRPKGYPLIKSAQVGNMDRVKLLISYGADPTIKNQMALRVCAARNNRAMVNYFLDELHLKPDKETLKACVQKNLWEMIQILVDHGAVPDMSTINFT
ncbi:hypothetical protein BDF20DRAFT_832726 [Mycotypha africana]|uniref:uncharacterized protein n=1 Tax=Mycotypha africana TaxID=64632 RepID=UPI0023006F8C|nr:uncharacterized protein BDF20DRAFT_832726 [Mycotypha africana]KAI8987827.1 hypothetical protein BDF20DRAFT_832726 [Mycotypha africana]